MIPAPQSMPEALQWLAYAGAVLVAVAGIFWRGFRWLLDRIDERFKSAIRSEEFETVIDKRVAAAFEGALHPLMRAYGEVQADARKAQATAEAAHRRIDRHHGKDHA